MCPDFYELFGSQYERMDDLTDTDKEVLFVLADSQLRLPPSVIANNLGNSQQYVRRRCKTLLDKEMIEDTGTGGKPYYRITDHGENVVFEVRNLEGEASDIESSERP